MNLQSYNHKSYEAYNKTIAVDFDGTLCYSRWPGTGEPNIELIEELIICRKVTNRFCGLVGREN
jgi:hypothetical protein